MRTGVLQIRPAGQADLSALLDLYQHLSPGDDRPSPAEAAALFDHFLAYRGSTILIGVIDGAVVASCTLVVVPNLTRGGKPYGLIENVVTHGDFRQQGFGKKLLDAAEAVAGEAGCYKLMLMTGSQNPKTLGFYRGAGFEQTKTAFQKRSHPARPDS